MELLDFLNVVFFEIPLDFNLDIMIEVLSKVLLFLIICLLFEVVHGNLNKRLVFDDRLLGLPFKLFILLLGFLGLLLFSFLAVECLAGGFRLLLLNTIFHSDGSLFARLGS